MGGGFIVLQLFLVAAGTAGLGDRQPPLLVRRRALLRHGEVVAGMAVAANRLGPFRMIGIGPGVEGFLVGVDILDDEMQALLAGGFALTASHSLRWQLAQSGLAAETETEASDWVIGGSGSGA